MTTYDNGEPLPDWHVIPKHCGSLCLVRDCPTCGVTVNPTIPPNITLGAE